MLRLVIQRVLEGEPPRPVYRLVAYPAPKGLSLRPARFGSRERLLERLRAAIPGFDENLLGSGLQTQVVFAGDCALSEEQLVVLGLTG